MLSILVIIQYGVVEVVGELLAAVFPPTPAIMTVCPVAKLAAPAGDVIVIWIGEVLEAAVIAIGPAIGTTPGVSGNARLDALMSLVPYPSPRRVMPGGTLMGLLTK